MAETYDFDIAIIGAGPGGYVAAIRAAQLGLKPVVIEKGKPGGVCLNIGCIPSKALIHQAEIFSSAAELESLGAKVDLSGFSYQKVWKKSRKASDTLSKGVQFLLRKNNVPLEAGNAVITGPHEITVDGSKKITASNIMVATGSRPIVIPGFEPDEEVILTSDGLLMMEELPKRLLVIGGGVIGCELAHVMNRFGVEVTIVEMLDRIVPTEEPDAVDVLAKSFKKRGIKILTSTKASGYKKGKTGLSAGLSVTLESAESKAEEIEVDKILVVVGRRPNTENIGLEEVGVKLDRGFVTTGDYYQTDVESIYAIGDVTASPLLAHVASKEGEIAVEHIAGHNPTPFLDPDGTPSAVYTEPQIASFGPTEAVAKERGLSYETATFPYRGAGKSVAIEQSDGLVKILYDPKTSEILGASIAGAEATELIHELLLAKTAELLPEDVATMIHAHPTLSEAVMEAMRAAEGWAIHA